MDLVTLDLGFDRFHVDLILAKCRTEGLKVNLLQMDDNGLAPGLIAMTPHKALVPSGDSARVTAIAEQVRTATAQGEPVTHKPGRVRSWFYRLLSGNHPS